jgi:hypothetical protein
MKKIVKDYVWELARNAAMQSRENGRFLLTQEKRLKTKVFTILSNQKKWVVEELEKRNVQTNSIDSEVDDFLGGMPYGEDLVAAIVAYGSYSMLRGGKEIVKNQKLGEFGISFDLKHPDAIKYMKEKTDFQLSNRKGTIDYTTKQRIGEILTDGISTGKSYQDMAKQITQQGQAGVFSRARAEMIAIREIGEAYEYGKYASMQEFLAKNPDRQAQKWWITAGDDKVTDECMANSEASPMPFNQAFPYSGGDQMMAPRYGHPRCRCNTQYEILP